MRIFTISVPLLNNLFYKSSLLRINEWRSKIHLQNRLFSFIVIVGQHVLGLAHAASGYHRVLEENRKLYNQVQDLKGA